MLHAKLFTVDDDVAVFGSSNMDMRSFSLNMEVSVLTVGAEMVESLSSVIEQYREVSEELTKEEWDARTEGRAWVDNVFRLTRPCSDLRAIFPRRDWIPAGPLVRWVQK